MALAECLENNMFNSTKRQRKKVARALREGNILYLAKWALFQLRLSSVFWFGRNGYKMRIFYVPFAFWLWTEREGRSHLRSDEIFYKTFLKEGDTVVDAGANIGLCTLMSGRLVGTEGHVHSFEPHPRTYRQLVSNIKLNKLKNVKSYNLGLSNKKETVSFSDEYVSDINHVDKNKIEKKQIQVELSTLDNILEQGVREIALLKLDVEGYELFAIEGAQETLKKTRLIYFESSKRAFDREGYGLSDIRQFLAQNDFTVYHNKDEFVLEKVSDDYESVSKYENLIALRTKDIEWFEQRTTL